MIINFWFLYYSVVSFFFLYVHNAKPSSVILFITGSNKKLDLTILGTNSAYVCGDFLDEPIEP